MNSSPNILIVVLNFRTPAHTLQCAESLRPVLDQFSGAQVVIVDNGSGESWVKALSTQLSASTMLAPIHDRVRLLCLPENGGYSVGNNAAILPALQSPNPPAYFWLLNSDTVVDSQSLDALVAAMESNPRIGIAGSRLQDADGTPQRSAFRFPNIPGEWESTVQWSWMTRLCARWVFAPPPPSTNTRIDWVPGASMLVRRQVFEQIGLLDQAFFLYFEDVDLCARAKSAGWETWYIPTSRVKHYTGATSNISSSRRREQRMPPYWFESRHRYYVKHHGTLYAAGADVAWLAGFGLWRLRRWLERKPVLSPPHFWRDFLAYSIRRKRTTP